RPAPLAVAAESRKVHATPRVVAPAAALSTTKPAITTVIVPQDPGAPMFGGSQRYAPVTMRKAFPPLHFDHALETQIPREIPHAPGHNTDLGMRQAPKGRFMEMIEVGVGQQNHINGRQILDFQTGALD